METRRDRLIRLRGNRSHEEIAAWLSDRLDRTIGKGTVWKWEQVDEPNIDLEVFFALAELYEIDPRQLATGEPRGKHDAPPNLLSLVDDYTSIDVDVRAPMRALIAKLAEHANNRAPPRKARDKNKTKQRPTVLETE